MKNGLIRTITGAAFVALIVACLLHPYSFVVLTLLVTVVLLHEFYTLAIGPKDTLLKCMGLLTAVVTFLLISLSTAGIIDAKYISLSILCCIAIIVCAVIVLRNRELKEITKVAYIFTGLLYIATPMALSNLVVFHDGTFNGMPILCFFAIIWCSDVGAYLLGSTFGQKEGCRKLCPSISPKKSWIGFWGGVLTAVAGAVILQVLHLFDVSLLHSIVLGVIISVAGVFGDLFESIWKRAFGVKDSGFIVPGHGGLLDRFDSTLAAMPVGCVYMVLFNLL